MVQVARIKYVFGDFLNRYVASFNLHILSSILHLIC